MSLNKAIEHGKERRRPYRGSKAVDYTCRNHGTCDWCKSNRMYNEKRELEKMKCRLTDFQQHINEYSNETA